MAGRPDPPARVQGRRWFTEADRNAILRQSGTDDADLLNEVYSFYRSLVVRNRFSDRLAPAQRELFFIIEKRKHWDNIAHAFIQDVNRCRMLSLFIETTNDVRRADSGPVYSFVVIATPAGLTAAFDLHKLAATQGVDHQRPLEFLPAIVRAWIKDPDFAVVGANIVKTLDRCAVPFCSTVDTRDIFVHFRRHRYRDELLINVTGFGNRDGVGAQAFYAKGEDFRPQLEHIYVDRYGPHRYTRGGRSHWPWWRNSTRFYRWRANTEGGHLDAHHQWYLWHTATTPFALFYRLLLERSLHQPRYLWRFASFAAAVRDLICEFISPLAFRADDMDETDDNVYVSPGSPAPSASGRGSASQATQRDRDRPPARRAAAARSGTAAARPSSPSSESSSSGSSSASSSTPSRSRSPTPPPEPDEDRPGSGFSSASVNALTDTDEDIPPAVKKRRAAVKSAAGSVRDWRSKEENQIPYITDPPLTRGCRCCGEQNHVFSVMRERTCPIFKLRKPGQRLCEYRFCRSPAFHLTSLCPWLHHICTRCDIRGHSEENKCEDWTEEEWERRRDAWETVADQGVHTGRREKDWRYGFYSQPEFSPYPFPYTTYAEMLSLPVLTVRQDLRRFDRGHWPRRTRRPCPPKFQRQKQPLQVPHHLQARPSPRVHARAEGASPRPKSNEGIMSTHRKRLASPRARVGASSLSPLRDLRNKIRARTASGPKKHRHFTGDAPQDNGPTTSSPIASQPPDLFCEDILLLHHTSDEELT